MLGIHYNQHQHQEVSMNHNSFTDEPETTPEGQAYFPEVASWHLWDVEELSTGKVLKRKLPWQHARQLTILLWLTNREARMLPADPELWTEDQQSIKAPSPLGTLGMPKQTRKEA